MTVTPGVYVDLVSDLGGWLSITIDETIFQLPARATFSRHGIKVDYALALSALHFGVRSGLSYQG